jgi:putative ABC transport system permease protein
MKTILGLALRNVGRNRRRSILALISVSLSLMLIVFMQGWINGIMQSMVKNYTKNETGHLRLATRSFEERSKFQPVTDNLKRPDSLRALLISNPVIRKEISLISERITFGTLLSNDGKNVTAMALSGNSETEKELLMLQESLLDGGRYISGPNEVIMGQILAQRLGFNVGDTLKIVATGSDYTLRLKKAAIVGLFKSGINQLDEFVFQLPIESARELLGMKGQTQQMIIMLHDWRKSDAVAQQIQRLILDTNLTITPWTKIGDYYQFIKMSEGIYWFNYIVIAFLGAFIIGNIMMMVVMERRKEIGILKSMGMSRNEILFLFLTEGVILGFIGSCIGIALGGIIITVLGISGVDITFMMQAMKIPVDNVIYPQLELSAVLSTLLLGTCVAAIVSLLPSRKAATMNAIEAIKSV